MKKLVSSAIGAVAGALFWFTAAHLLSRAEDPGIGVIGCVRTIATQDHECV